MQEDKARRNYEYTELLNKRILYTSFEDIAHDFNGPQLHVCSRCSTHRADVMAGSASWVCNVQVSPQKSAGMPCCGKSGFLRWDYNNAEWVCSVCAAVSSNDPHYTGIKQDLGWDGTKTEQPTWAIPTVVHPPQPKKCTCHINDLMRGGCSCGGV